MPSSTKKKRVYWLVVDDELYYIGRLVEDKDFAKVVASQYNEDAKRGGKNKKFNVMRITLSADTAKWK